MKNYIYLLISLLGLSQISYSQISQDKNYVHEINYTTQTDIQNSQNVSDEDKIEKVIYFDGSSRTMQVVNMRSGGNQENVIKHFEYDDFGIVSKKYLPFADEFNSGQFVDDALTRTQNFYNTDKYENTLNPYNESVRELSPLNNVIEMSNPGNDWNIDNDHTVKLNNGMNTANDFVKKFKVEFLNNNTANPQLVDEGIHEANNLFKNSIKNENWSETQSYIKDNTIDIFKDRNGRTILNRKYNKDKFHDTYYVYDKLGNLTFVLPPKLYTYVDFWQTEASSQQYSVGADDVFEPGYSRHSGGGQLYFSPSSNQINVYRYGYTWGSNNLQVTFKNGLAKSIPSGVNLSNIQLTGQLNYTDFMGVSHTANVTAHIEDDELFLDSGFPNTQLIIKNYSFSLSGSTVGIDFTVPDVSTSDLEELAYQYIYDQRNNLVKKKLPGKGWEFIVYDRLNRPVLMQDPNLRAEDKWVFRKYDQQGRSIYSGIVVDNRLMEVIQGEMYDINNGYSLSESRVSTASSFTNNSLSINYTNLAFPTTNIDIHNVNYYDDYEFDTRGIVLNDDPSTGSKVPELSNIVYNSVSDFNSTTKNHKTGSQVKVLEDGNNKWITSVILYDKRSRPIYVQSENEFLKTDDVVNFKLDFIGSILESSLNHKKEDSFSGSSVNVDIINKFTYDSSFRLIKQTQKINDQSEELLFFNEYDELGRLIQKKVGGNDISSSYPSTSALQKLDYEYNIRGWLKSINNPTSINNTNDLFGFGLNYQSPNGPNASSTFNTENFNGNISHIYWKTDNLDSKLRHYTYRYDALSRFTNSYYAENESFNGLYNTIIYNYDRNGNILELNRTQPNPNNSNSSIGMDRLRYSYNTGNKLMEVEDTYGTSASGSEGFFDGNTVNNDYEYDLNGNLIKDLNKEITEIEYNHLNLPERVEFESSNFAGKNIQYIYDANGNKLAKKVQYENQLSTKNTYYAGDFIYDQNNDFSPEQIKFIQQPEGYLEPKNPNNLSLGFNYIYQYKDHLGNIRLSYSDKDNDNSITGGSESLFFDDVETASGWEGLGSMHGVSAQYDASKSLSGSYSAKIERNTHGNSFVHSNNWISFNHTQATEYIFSGWIYVESNSSAWGRLVFFMNEDDETDYFTEVSHSDRVYTKDRWVYVEQKALVQPNIDKINLRIGMYTNTNAKVWFDNLSIRKVNPDDEVEIIEEKNYYAFGLKHKGYNNVINGTYNPYGFSGNEENDEHDINNMDFGWRSYNPSLSKWQNPDPLAENDRSLSPYNFAFNNPVNYIDPNGLWPDPYDQDYPEPDYGAMEEYYMGGRNGRGGYYGDDIYDFYDNYYYDVEEDYNADIYIDSDFNYNSKGEIGDRSKLNKTKNNGRGYEFDVNSEILDEVLLVSGKGLSPEQIANIMDQIYSNEYYDSVQTPQSGFGFMDGINYSFSAAGTGVGGLEFAVGRMNNKQLWRNSYKTHQTLKRYGYNIRTSTIKHGAKGFLKNASRKITYVGGFIALGDIIVDGELRWSHVINISTLGVSAIPVVGWAIGGGFFVADMIVLVSTGQSIGEHADEAAGEPIFDW